MQNKKLIIKSYLINNKKDLDISSYKELIKDHLLKNDNYEVSIYSDFKDSIDFLTPLKDKFEESILEEFKKTILQSVLLLKSNDDWIIAFEKNHQNGLNLSKIEKLKELNKFSLENNNNIFSVYSKVFLKKEEEVIKQFSYSNLYSAESKKLFLLSNKLIDMKIIDIISNQLSVIKANYDARNFLDKRIEIKANNTYNSQFISYLDDLNLLFKNIINLSNQGYLEIIKQTIPEKSPIFYLETSYELM